MTETEKMMERYRLARARTFPTKPIANMVTHLRHPPVVPALMFMEPQLEPLTPEKVWADYYEWLPTAQPTDRDVCVIIQEAVDRYGYPARAIKGGCRIRLLVAVRQTTMSRAYVERPELSLTQLGRWFGGKDHTTVLHAIRKAQSWRNPGFIPFAPKRAA